MTLSDEIAGLLADYEILKATEEGIRVPTHCLYPSFEPVDVFVSKKRDGFEVHDSGNAYRSAWAHGRDPRLIANVMEEQAARFNLTERGNVLVARVSDKEWLTAAILAVANASAATANAAVAKFVAAAETSLKERIGRILEKTVPKDMPTEERFSLRGKSGKQHVFDFAVVRRDAAPILLIDAVAPHHNSIAAKYVAFSDVKAALNEPNERFAVFDRALEHDDAALMEQVADLVPLASFAQGTQRALSYERHRKVL
ncbi:MULTISPECIES: DUF1829 domain-containing protein [unclassified Mesorhizobium]|uniref:DUF1829 domain-containing protein n=1 Tax=unclassified Mesorhizobium TaxID=325217 RepID=UPI003337CE5C